MFWNGERLASLEFVCWTMRVVCCPCIACCVLSVYRFFAFVGGYDSY